MILSFTRYWRILCIVIFSANLIGCGSFKNGNFNRQKYTKLKKIEAKPEAVNDDSKTENKDESEPIPVTNSTFQDEVITEIIDCQPGLDQIQFPETEISTELEEVQDSLRQDPPRFTWGPENAPGNKDFKKFTQTEKNKAIIEFNRLFNAGLAILLLAFICFIIFGILAAGPTSLFMWYFFVAGSLSTFFAWIISLLALNKVRRIRERNFVGDLGIKVWLARIVAFIGIGVCVITVFGGIVLGILWLFRLI